MLIASEDVDLICGAKSKRTGQPCLSKAIFKNGRCRFHGGLSSGPKTEAGKQASRKNGRKGGRPRKRSLNEDCETPAMPAEAQEYPNPMDVTTDVTGFGQGAPAVTKAVTNRKPCANAQPLRSCADCEHLSAAHTCMIGAGRWFPGERHECESFAQSQWY